MNMKVECTVEKNKFWYCLQHKMVLKVNNLFLPELVGNTIL